MYVVSHLYCVVGGGWTGGPGEWWVWEVPHSWVPACQYSVEEYRIDLSDFCPSEVRQKGQVTYFSCLHSIVEAWTVNPRVLLQYIVASR
jgi:hypothetical protein